MWEVSCEMELNFVLVSAVGGVEYMQFCLTFVGVWLAGIVKLFIHFTLS